MDRIFWDQGPRVQASRFHASRVQAPSCPQSKRPSIQSPSDQSSRVQASSLPESKRPFGQSPSVQACRVEASRVQTSRHPKSKRPESSFSAMPYSTLAFTLAKKHEVNVEAWKAWMTLQSRFKCKIILFLASQYLEITRLIQGPVKDLLWNFLQKLLTAKSW